MKHTLHIPKIDRLDLRPPQADYEINFVWPKFPVKVQQFIEGK